ncbi:MAG TPA: transcriptional regulator [Pseudogracilibacillus sp.]|nr:transcriptional regulator [Pseudogracilibacillus sp.]
MRNYIMKYAKITLKLQIMYISDSGKVTKRTVQLIKINSSTFTAYCFMRKARRTFKFSNVLAIVPVYEREVV